MKTTMKTTTQTTIQRDLEIMVSLRDARAVGNAASRERCRNDVGLCAVLLEQAQRRGQAEINWPDYFRSLDINYP